MKQNYGLKTNIVQARNIHSSFIQGQPICPSNLVLLTLNDNSLLRIFRITRCLVHLVLMLEFEPETPLCLAVELWSHPEADNVVK